jgi:hypothetical protein
MAPEKDHSVGTEFASSEYFFTLKANIRLSRASTEKRKNIALF